MVPTLIVLALLALGVGIVAYATRRSGARPAPVRNDTGWNDPITPADEPGVDDRAPTASDGPRHQPRSEPLP